MKISPRWIKEELDKVVAGQSEAKETLAVAAYTHYMRWYHRFNNYDFDVPPKLNTLIVGPTGSGKTMLIDALGQVLSVFPIHKIDASQLSKAGYVGSDLSDHITAYVEQNETYFNNLDFGIFYIDEIDKLGQNVSSDSSWNLQIQNSLLTAMEGIEIPIGKSSVSFNTGNLWFIFSGAFEDAYGTRQCQESNIGFNAELHKQELKTNYKTPLTRDELEKTGLRRELIGRFNVVTNTYPLTRDEIRYALAGVYNSFIDQYRALLQMSGDDDEALMLCIVNEIVEDVYRSSYGMRYAKSVLFDKLKNKLFAVDGVRHDKSPYSKRITFETAMPSTSESNSSNSTNDIIYNYEPSEDKND